MADREGKVLWEPSAELLTDSKLARYMRDRGFASYDELWRWSVEDLDGFITGLFGGRLLGHEMMTRLFTVPDVSMSDGSSPALYSQGLMRIVVNGLEVWGKTGSRHGYSSGVFATRGLERKLVYSVNPTTKSPDGQPLIVQKIAAAATA